MRLQCSLLLRISSGSRCPRGRSMGVRSTGFVRFGPATRTRGAGPRPVGRRSEPAANLIAVAYVSAMPLTRCSRQGLQASIRNRPRPVRCTRKPARGPVARATVIRFGWGGACTAGARSGPGAIGWPSAIVSRRASRGRRLVCSSGLDHLPLVRRALGGAWLAGRGAGRVLARPTGFHSLMMKFT
jgi:hypothetical protein